MSFHLTPAPQPVEQSYGGGDTIAVRRLQEAISVINSNFTTVGQALDRLITSNGKLHADNSILRGQNDQLVQLLNWIAATNPQILNEFQTTAHAFEKLSPRNPESDAAYTQAGP